MTKSLNGRVPRLMRTAHAIIQSTRERFCGLASHQLNWKPGVDEWSIAQCYEHLVTANTAYFPAFETILSGAPVDTFWTRLPWYPVFWGKVLVRAFGPDARRRLKAPRMFRPSRGSIDEAIIDRFIDQQHQLIRYMDATKDMDVERIIISSPVTRFVTYSLMDTYRILIAHEQRHIRQATRVLDADGFPPRASQS